MSLWHIWLNRIFFHREKSFKNMRRNQTLFSDEKSFVIDHFCSEKKKQMLFLEGYNSNILLNNNSYQVKYNSRASNLSSIIYVYILLCALYTSTENIYMRLVITYNILYTLQ